jgi:hypothetical protein
VPLPPTEEGLYIPAQLVDLGNLFGCKIKAIGDYLLSAMTSWTLFCATTSMTLN